LGDPGVVGRIILRWMFRKLDVEVWTGSSWLRIGLVGTCECCYESSGSIKCRDFFILAENRSASQEGLCSVEYVSKVHATLYSFPQKRIK
jgi:hypothetical protein